MKATAVILAAAALSACTAASPGNQAPAPRQLGGELRDAQRRTVGRVELLERGESTQVRLTVTGLAPGEHGVHFHDQPRCDAPDFSTAGGHFNPGGRQHGAYNPGGPHAGDLPNLVVRPDSTGTLDHTTARITLQPDAPNAFDAARGAFVVHAGRDDQRTDPSGNSGARIACALFGAPVSGRRTS